VSRAAFAPLKPIRMSPDQAADYIGGIGAAYIRNKLIPAGVFTPIRPFGFGKGKRVYLLTEEVEAYAYGGEQAVKDLRSKRKRKATP
jgi:hypothetical protein